MTKKLYYKNSYMKKFDTHVCCCEFHDGNYRIVLDETAFYPGGGGQPADIGTVNGVKVLEVFEKEDKIYHILNQKFEVGEAVSGKIDFENRFDYMQQHSGEHILSGIINTLYGLNNVGFHLSKQYMTADFDGELTKEQLEEVEKRVNQAIYANKPLEEQIYTDTELENVTYRSKLDLKGTIRLVTVKDCDVCACCGTHVKEAGEIGLLKIVSAEKYKSGMRLTILCGERAREDYVIKLETITQLSQLLSTKPQDVLDGVERLREELCQIKQLVVGRTQMLLEVQAHTYEGQAFVCINRDDLSPDELRRFCTLLVGCTEGPCIVLGSDEKGLRYVIGSRRGDIRPLCKILNQAFNGKGGGNQTMCQGTLQTDFETAESYWRGLEKTI